MWLVVESLSTNPVCISKLAINPKVSQSLPSTLIDFFLLQPPAAGSLPSLAMEVASLVLGVAGLLPVLIQGRRLVAHYRRSRRWRLQASGSTPLVTEIDHSRTEINNRFSDFHRAYGEAFARGDGEFQRSAYLTFQTDKETETARNQLNRLVIMLQHELIEVLMTSRIGGRLNSVPLINVTSTSRVDAIDAMATLAQRVENLKRRGGDWPSPVSLCLLLASLDKGGNCSVKIPRLPLRSDSATLEHTLDCFV